MSEQEQIFLILGILGAVLFVCGIMVYRIMSQQAQMRINVRRVEANFYRNTITSITKKEEE